MSLRGLAHTFNVYSQGFVRWNAAHVKSLPTLKATLLPAKPDDVLEYDES